jgi:hypothetical protein
MSQLAVATSNPAGLSTKSVTAAVATSTPAAKTKTAEGTGTAKQESFHTPATTTETTFTARRVTLAKTEERELDKNATNGNLNRLGIPVLIACSGLPTRWGTIGVALGMTTESTTTKQTVTQELTKLSNASAGTSTLGVLKLLCQWRTKRPPWERK